MTRGLPKLTRWNNFRIRLLVSCDGLEADASRFRMRSNSTTAVNDPSCKLCKSEPESPSHFIVRCPSLSCIRESLLCDLHFCIDLRSILISQADRTTREREMVTLVQEGRVLRRHCETLHPPLPSWLTPLTIEDGRH